MSDIKINTNASTEFVLRGVEISAAGVAGSLFGKL
jgi:hypothetical protein